MQHKGGHKPHVNKSSNKILVISSVQFNRSVVPDSLRPHGLQHARPPCPSATPGFYPNSCPLSWWYHPTISSSVTPFSSCPQFFPASGSFPASQFFESGSQHIGASAPLLPIECSGLISFRTDWVDLLAVQESSPAPHWISLLGLL